MGILEKNNQKGLFPANFCRRIYTDEEEASRKSKSSSTATAKSREGSKKSVAE